VLPGQLDFGDVCHRFQNWQFAHQCGKPHVLVIDFLQSRPKIGARGETGDAFGTDLNSFAIFGVAQPSRLAMQNSEGAEAGNGDAVSAHQTRLNSLKAGVEGSGRLIPGQFRIGRNFSYQIFPIHEAPVRAKLIKIACRCQSGKDIGEGHSGKYLRDIRGRTPGKDIMGNSTGHTKR
jgi:hypothetical protein